MDNVPGARFWKPLTILFLLVFLLSFAAPPAPVQAVGALEVSITTSTPNANTGDTVNYTITLTAVGSSSFTNVHLDDVLPSIGGMVWTGDPNSITEPNNASITTVDGPPSEVKFFAAQLNPNDSMSIEMFATVPAAANCQTLSDVANVSADNVSTFSSSPTNIVISCPSLALNVTTTSPTANTGGTVNYTINLTNNGPSSATNVSFDDVLPSIGGMIWNGVAGSIVLPSQGSITVTSGPPTEVKGVSTQLDPGKSFNIELTATVPAAAACQTLSNVANASANNIPQFSSSPANITINCAADLTIAKHHSGNFLQGQTGARYTLTVSNVGTGSSSGTVTVADSLPSGLTATAISGSGWNCTLSTLTCTRADALAVGSSYPDITVTVNVDPLAPASLTNTATVSGGGDASPGNDTASDPTNITQVSGLISPTTATCSQFASGTAASLSGVAYTVGSTGKISAVSPSAFFYYTKVVAPSSSFSITVTQSNTSSWPNLGNYFSFFNPQINVFNSSCSRINTTGTFMPTYITFNVTGATPGALYYVGIRYQADSVVGKSVSQPYPSVPYTFATSLNSTTISANTRSITFHP